MKCGFGANTCNSEAVCIATRKAGWQHSMNFSNLKMTKAWRKKKKTPCCEFHRKRMGETYPGDYSFSPLEGTADVAPIVSGRDPNARS